MLDSRQCQRCIEDGCAWERISPASVVDEKAREMIAQDRQRITQLEKFRGDTLCWAQQIHTRLQELEQRLQELEQLYNDGR
jgi:chaperonin cofactor prefoldin